MSLVDYGFYSDEEEEEERERQRPQKQELPDSGPRRGSRSNDSVPDVSCPPQPEGFFQQDDRKESLSSTVPPQQEITKGVAFLGEEKEDALLSPLSRKKRNAASLSRAEPTADESASADLRIRRQWEGEDAGEATSSVAAVRRREGGGTADQADAEERAASGALLNASAAATAGPRKRARENRRSPGSSAEASSSSPSPSASLLQQQPLQSGGTGPRDNSSSVKQQLTGIITLQSAGEAITAANQAAPPVNADSEQDAARSTPAGSSCVAGASSPMPFPTLPPGEAPKELLRTVERLRQLRARGITVNGNIAASLDFKNPYLLEKIMKVFDIDPYCSNYSVSVFDPSNIIPWEPRAGTPFAVQLVRRFEQRRQQRRDAHVASKEVKEDSSAATASVGNSAVVGTHAAAPAAGGHTSASAAAGPAAAGPVAGGPAAAGPAAAATHQASSAEASEGPPEGGTQRPRSRFERISPPAVAAGQQQQQHTAGPASGFSSMCTGLPAGAPLVTGSGFNAAFQHAAFEAMVKAGAMASVVQQQLQQRLLTMHSALTAQQQHCGSMASRDASSAAALAAAAAAAAMSHRSQQQQQPLQQQVQQNGPSTVGTGLNRQRPSALPFSLSPPLPTASTIAGHAAAAAAGSGAASSYAGDSGCASSQVDAAGAAASGLRSSDSAATKSREEANVKIKQLLKPSPVQPHRGEKETAVGIGTAAHQHHLEPMQPRQPTSSVTSSSIRWGDSRGECSSNTSSSSLLRGDLRLVSSVQESVKPKATAGTESKRKF